MLDVRSPLLADLLCRLMADPEGRVAVRVVDDNDGEQSIRLDVSGGCSMTDRELFNLKLATPQAHLAGRNRLAAPPRPPSAATG